MTSGRLCVWVAVSPVWSIEYLFHSTAQVGGLKVEILQVNSHALSSCAVGLLGPSCVGVYCLETGQVTRASASGWRVASSRPSAIQ